MERLKNGIYATVWNMRIKNAYEEIEEKFGKVCYGP